MTRSSSSKRSSALAGAALAGLASVALAQYNPATCTGAPFDVIVNLQDGTNLTIPNGVIGTEGTTVTWQVTGGGVQVKPNPAFPTEQNFWFFKFDTAECFDIRTWNTAEFEYMADAGSNFGWTFTVHQPSCKLAGDFGCFNATFQCPRAPDSSYHFLNEYGSPTTTGAWQKISLPLYDFRISNANNATDFQFIKDWTFVNMKPATSTFSFRNFRLRCRPDYPSITNLPSTLTNVTSDPAGFKWDRTGIDYTGTTIGTKVNTVSASATTAAAVSGASGAASATSGAAGAAPTAAAGTNTNTTTGTKSAAPARVAGSWSLGAMVAALALVFGL